MVVEISLIISAAAVICTIIMTIVTLKRNTHSDSKIQATEMTTVIVKLDAINSNVAEIKADIKGVKSDVQELRDRVIIVEQSSKSAHKRLDSLTKLKDTED